MDIIIPEKLQTGDTIGIIAPSKAPRRDEFTEIRIQNASAFLESLGLKVKFAPHVYNNGLYCGAQLSDRIDDIHNMFADPSVKMIMMACGGYYTSLIADKIDYSLIRNNPKIFSGFSDGTVLTTAFFQRSGLQTYYGHNLIDTLGFPFSDAVKQNFVNTFFKAGPLEIAPNPQLKLTNWSTGNQINDTSRDWSVIKSGTAQGILIGGLLQRLLTMDFAGFCYDYRGKILFIESTRDFVNFCIEIIALKQRGVFEQINGLIVGYGIRIENQKQITEFLEFIFKGYDFPVVQIGELGHFTENYAYPVGASAELDTSAPRLTIFNP